MSSIIDEIQILQLCFLYKKGAPYWVALYFFFTITSFILLDFVINLRNNYNFLVNYSFDIFIIELLGFEVWDLGIWKLITFLEVCEN